MAACATYPAAYHRAMKTMQRLSKTAHAELMQLDPKSWSKAFFQTHRGVDNVENNMSECFNNWIVNERYILNLSKPYSFKANTCYMIYLNIFFCRYMPLLNMLQEIHFKIMRRIRINRQTMQRG